MADATVLEWLHKANECAKKMGEDTKEKERCLDVLHVLLKTEVEATTIVKIRAGAHLKPLTAHADVDVSKRAKELRNRWKQVVANASTVHLSETKTKSQPSTKNVPAPSHRNQTKRIEPPQGTRGKAVELLKTAMEDVEEEQKVDATVLERIAQDVERGLHEHFGDNGKGYKAQLRTILFNLRDKQNPDFKRNLREGNIRPETLATLSPEGMASERKKEEIQQIRAHALWECERGQVSQQTTDQFQCGKCKQRKCTYYQMQTRSADEPMTTFVSCVNCGNRWKFC